MNKETTNNCIKELISGTDDERSEICSILADTIESQRYIQNYEKCRRDQQEQEFIQHELDRLTPPKSFFAVDYHSLVNERYWKTDEGIKDSNRGNEIRKILNSSNSWSIKADQIEIIFLTAGIEWSRGLRSIKLHEPQPLYTSKLTIT